MADVDHRETLSAESDVNTARLPDTLTEANVHTAINTQTLRTARNSRNTSVRTARASTSSTRQLEVSAFEYVAASLLFTFQLAVGTVNFIIASGDAITNFFVNVYNVGVFCYHKPDVAKDLAKTTYHLLKVSYDNDLLTLSEIYAVTRNNILLPMTRANATRNVQRADRLTQQSKRSSTADMTSMKTGTVSK